MSTTDLIRHIHDPEFYERVGFLSIKTAQQVASEDPNTENHVNRVNYANRIFTGSENNIQLSEHVVSSNVTIAQKLEAEGPSGVPDADIEFALATIWDARSIAFGNRMPPPEMLI